MVKMVVLWKSRQSVDSPTFPKICLGGGSHLAVLWEVTYLPHSIMESITLPATRRTNVSMDLTSVEAALRQIVPSDIEERLLAQIPQWFLVTKMFKELEIAYTLLEDRSEIEQKYRAVLTGILALGENIVAGLKDRPGIDLHAINYCPEVVGSTLQYLRLKHQQWFSPRDSVMVRELLEAIHRETQPSI